MLFLGLYNEPPRVAPPDAEKYAAPIFCREYGIYNKCASFGNRCRYIKAVRQTLILLNIS